MCILPLDERVQAHIIFADGRIPNKGACKLLRLVVNVERPRAIRPRPVKDPELQCVGAEREGVARWRRRLKEEIHLAFSLRKLVGRSGRVELCGASARKRSSSERIQPQTSCSSSIEGNPRPRRSVVRRHHPLQHRLLFLTPTLGVEELVPETLHTAEGAVLDLLEEFALDKVQDCRPNNDVGGFVDDMAADEDEKLVKVLPHHP